MTREPAISVILAVRNEHDTITHALQRLERQSFRSFEIVVVDDGSTDATAQVAESFVATVPLRVLRRPPLGVAAARNAGLAVTAGEWVWFVDADDDWSGNALALLHARGTSAGADLVVARSTERLPGGQESLMPGIEGERVLDSAEVLAEFLAGRLTGHLWNKLFRRESLGSAPFASLRSRSDLSGVIAALPRIHRAATVDSAVYTYVLRPGSITTSHSATPVDLLECGNLAERMFLSLPHPPGPRARLDYRYSHVVFRAWGDLWRFWPSIENRGAVIRELRGALSWRDAAALAVARRPVIAARVVLLLIAPGLARRAFTVARRARWRALDAG